MQPSDVPPPLTLDALDTWPVTGCDLAVLGQPVAHSLSPAMHHAALSALAQTLPPLREWRYHKFEVAPADLPVALPRFAEAGFRGLNLTLPHKIQAVDLVEQIAAEGKRAGAVNTLRLIPETGRYAGYNTDGFGLLKALERDLGVDSSAQPAVLLGAGGAARAAAMALLGANCPQLWLANRSPEPLAQLKLSVATHFPDGPVTAYPLGELPALPEGAVIVNATSLGLKPNDPCPLPVPLQTGHRVYDMTYGCDNALAQKAREASAAYADGLSMLVWQGQRALEIWTGVPVPAQPMMLAACAAKGMPAREV
ncbi:MAG: shikimate dehydrogenase family protein [Opitutales bacterium]